MSVRASNRWVRSSAAFGSWLPAILIAVVFSTFYWHSMDGLPTGLDAANWLALGRGLVGGSGRSTPGPYPPLVPFLTWGIAAATTPVVAAEFIAIASAALTFLAVYWLAKSTVSWWFALAAASLVFLCRSFTEPVAFGGAPQNFAMGLMLIGDVALVRYLTSGKASSWWLFSVSGVALSLAHHGYFLLGFVTAIAALAICTVRDRKIPEARRRWSRAALGLGLAAATAAPVAVELLRANYRPPVNPSHLSLLETSRYVLTPWYWFWILLLAATPISLAVSRRKYLNSVWPAFTSIWVVSSLAYLLMGEARVLAPAVAAGGALHALTLQDLWLRMRRRSVGGLVLSLPLGLIIMVPSSLASQQNDLDYYRVLNPDMMGAITWMKGHQGESVAIASNARGWPVGWWFEGLEAGPGIVGADPRWLAFPEERHNAEFVGRLLSAQTGPDAKEVALTRGIRYVAFDRSQWIGWAAWLSTSRDIGIGYENGQWMIVDLKIR